jgi:cytochrome P450
MLSSFAMNYSTFFLILLPLCSLVVVTIKKVIAELRKDEERKLHGLVKPKRLPLFDPFFGTDLNITIFNQIRRSRLLEGLDDRFHQFGYTHSFRLGLTLAIATCDPENIKSINADAITFPVGNVRRKAMSILHGRGIFAVEGADWQQSRSALRPSFAKGQHDNIAVLESHFQEMLYQMTLSNFSVDMQDVYHRFTMDTATQYFFGISPRESGQACQVDEFLKSIDYVNDTVYLALVFGNRSPMLIWRWRQTKKQMRVVHAFVEQHVQRVLNQNHEPSVAKSGRYIFLDELSKSKSAKDPTLLRDQVLTSMLGGKDTT